MAVNHVVKPELASFVESLIRPSVVLVIVDNTPAQTGFFVSRDGLVCTCIHGPLLFSHNKVSVRWNGRTYPANLIFSSARADLVLLAVQDLGDPPQKTPPLPISSEPLPTSKHRHAAASLGYAGLETYGTLEEPKMPIGELTIKYDFSEHQERFEIYGISGDKGNSGAPVMDLQRLRVLGYVQSSYEATKKQIGHALTFKALLNEYPELIEDWRWACQEFDLALAHHYSARRFPIDLEYCPGDLVSGLVSTHLADVFESHRDKKLFQLNRYVPRAVETDIITFMEESTSNLLLLSGASGSGKTSLLLNLMRQLDRERYLPVLIKCKGLKVGDLLQTVFNTLLPIEHYEPTRLGQLFDRCPDKKWVLFIDGLNECTGFSLSEFRELVEALCSLTEKRDVRLKVVFSLRAEFLREYLQSFFSWQSARQADLEADLLQFFQRDDRGRPYIRVGRINKLRLPDGRLELEAMYDQYCETGLRPTTPFEQLSEPIRKMLDRPFVLDLMMQTYNGAEIPLLMGRSNLIRVIVHRMLEKAGIERDSEVGRMEIYLSRLADFILRSPNNLSCLDSDLENQRWHKDEYLDKLLDISFLEREAIQRRLGNKNLIRFGADWTFEFFIAWYLWEEWWPLNSGKNLTELLSELHLFLPQEEEIDKINPQHQHLLVALLFFAEWAVTDEPSRFSFLVMVMNDSEQSSFAKGFIREALDFFRITYGLSQQIPSYDESSSTTILDLLSRNAEHFGETGGEGFLDYVEYLEAISKYSDALALLNLDACRRAVEGNLQLRARRQISLALNSHFSDSDDFDTTLSYANKVEVQELPPELQAKHAFIVGRVHQYKEDFLQAEKAYEIGQQRLSLYGYRCEHQLAFIKVVVESDFVAALAKLEHTLENPTFGVSPELKFESRLLRATCLFRIGRYREAEEQLREVVKFLGGQRNKKRLGKALRVLAELQSRLFEYESAIGTIEKAIEALRDGPALTLASTWDTKANIVGLLAGDLKTARYCNQKSLELCQDKKHRGTRQWCLQTSALLSALEGDLDETNRFLDEAGVSNPYEKLLRQFVFLLALHRTGQNTEAGFETQILQLRGDFEDLQLAWYPGVLSLILIATSGVTPCKEEVAALFSKDIDLEGLTNSYLYEQIFAVL